MNGQTGQRDAQLVKMARWARELRYDDIPVPTRHLATSQLVSNIAAVKASVDHPHGVKLLTAYGAPNLVKPKQCAFILAALAILLDYDEVSYVGHLSAAAVNVSIAHAADHKLNGRQLLTAIVAANECASRLTAATILGPFFRGQSSTHTHLLGAAVACLKSRNPPLQQWVSSMSLSLGMLPAPVHDAILGGDLKALTAATPVRMALDACDAGLAGLTGNAAVLDDPDGLLATLSAVYMPEAITAGLGKAWHTDTLSFKRFPASAYSQAVLECAERIHRRFGALESSRVERIEINASILTWLLDRKISTHAAGYQRNVTSANFSVRYAVATVLRDGFLKPVHFTTAAIADTATAELADKIVIVHDFDYTEAMIRATAPLGQAVRQAGTRALQWPELHAFGGEDVEARLHELGPAEETFAEATMNIGADLTVTLIDGTTIGERCATPTGFAGPATKMNHVQISTAKLIGTGLTAGIADELHAIADLDHHDTMAVLSAAFESLRPPATSSYCSTAVDDNTTRIK